MAGIPITLNFDLQAPLPLDSRLLVANTNQLNSINPKYSGMVVYAANTKKLYYLEDLNTNTWSQIGTGSFIGGGSLNNVVYTSGDQTISGSKTFLATGFYYSGGFYRYDRNSRTIFEDNVFINKINDQTSFGIYNHYFLNKNLPISGQLSSLPLGIRTGNIVNLFFNNSAINNSIENNILVEPTVMIRYTGNSFPNNIIPIRGHSSYSGRALKKINYNGITENVVYTTGNQSISGIKNFRSRPTVNGTGVLLSGEIPRLPETILYTTGNQDILGEKTFKAPGYFLDSVSIETNKWFDKQVFTGDFNRIYYGNSISSNKQGTLMFVSDNSNVSIYNRNNIQEDWSLLQRFNLTGYIGISGIINEVHFNDNISTLFVGGTLRIGPNITGENVYIFTGSNQVGWNNLHSTITGYGNLTPINGQRFGEEIKSISNGDIILISANHDDEKGVDAGAIFLYTGSLSQGWKLKQKIVPPNIQNYQYFGSNVDISSDGSVIFATNGGDIVNSILTIYTGSKNSAYLQKQIISMPTYAPIPPWPTRSDRIASINCESDGSQFIITRSKIEENNNNTHIEIYTGNKNIGWGVEETFQTNINAFNYARTESIINKNRNVIVVGDPSAYGNQGALSFFVKNLITNEWKLNQVIIPNSFPFTWPNGNPPLRLGNGYFGTSLAINEDGSFLVAGGPSAPIIPNQNFGYLVTFNSNKQFVYLNSQQPNSPLVNISGEVTIYGQKPKYNNLEMLVKGEAIEPDSDARLKSLTFNNNFPNTLGSPRIASLYQGSGMPTALSIYSDYAEFGYIVDFTETGVSFPIRPKVNGSGVLLQGEATIGGGSDAFNGNRGITLNIPGFKDLNVGGNTISGFLNNLFFPFTPATISLNSYSLQELGTTYVQVPFNGTITQNSETQISNLQYMLDNTVLNTITSPGFGNFSTSFTLNLTNNSTVRARVSTNNNGSPTTITGSQLISFIAPSWYGVGANGIRTGIKNMTKYLNTKGNRTFAFNTTNNHFYYGYPNDWGLLSSIIDQNGFNITLSFSNTTGNLLLADNTTNYVYRIYQSIIPSTNTNFNITFNF